MIACKNSKIRLHEQIKVKKYMDKVIGIGEYVISNDPEDTIKTFALSSCVALTAYHPKSKVLGMVHIALPSSKEKPVHNPFYYAESAVPEFLEKFSSEYGCNRPELEIKVFGGAESIRKRDCFNIGKRNVQTILSILKHMNLPVRYCDIGGHISRNVIAEVATGTVKVSCRPINF